MTDLLGDNVSVPARLGVVAELLEGELRLQLSPRAEVLRHGAVRASVLALMIDVVAGIVLDDDPDAWMLTSDMSVRMRPLPAPRWITTESTVLRRGRRSATAVVDLVTLLPADNEISNGELFWFWQVALVVPGILLAVQPLFVKIRQPHTKGAPGVEPAPSPAR